MKRYIYIFFGYVFFYCRLNKTQTIRFLEPLFCFKKYTSLKFWLASNFETSVNIITIGLRFVKAGYVVKNIPATKFHCGVLLWQRPSYQIIISGFTWVSGTPTILYFFVVLGYRFVVINLSLNTEGKLKMFSNSSYRKLSVT